MRLALLWLLFFAPQIAFAQTPLRLGVTAREVLKTSDGRAAINGRTTIPGLVQQLLADRGYELRALPEELSLAPDRPPAPAELAESGRRAGADLVLYLAALVEDRRPISADVLPSDLKILSEAHLIDVDNGKILLKIELKTEANGRDPDAAIHHAFTRRADSLNDRLMRALQPVLLKQKPRQPEVAGPLDLHFSGISEFREQGRAILEIVKAVEGVKEVDVRDYHEGTLIISVLWRGRSEDLAAEIVRECAKTRLLQGLRFDRAGSGKLFFKKR